MEDFNNWILLGNLSLNHAPHHCDIPAVYAMRNKNDKSIFKFGCTGNLRQRIWRNYIGGVGGDTTQRIHAMLFTNEFINQVEIAWIETPDRFIANEKEKKFRKAHKELHGQRPIWDLNG